MRIRADRIHGAFRIIIVFTLLIVAAGTVSAQRNLTEEDYSEISRLVAEMPLEQKIAQMIIPSMRVWNVNGYSVNLTELNDDLREVLRRYSFGGVVLFGSNILNAEQTSVLVHDIQQTSLEGGADALLFISTDQEGGYVTRLNTGTQMPGNMALAASGNPKNAELSATVIGQELASLGINVDFAPVVDVNNNPSNPVIGVRAFSDDPTVISSYAIPFINGLHASNVISCLKHFPGHGDSDVDSHTGLPLISKTLDELMQNELLPYIQVLPYTDMVMTAHIQFPMVETDAYWTQNGVPVYLPATLSKTFMTDILRGMLGFNGVAVTDAMEMDAINTYFGKMDAARLAINAGVDMLTLPVDLTDTGQIYAISEYINGIVWLVETGAIPMERIDESVTRILVLKARYGLLEKSVSPLDAAQIQYASETVGSTENHETEWEIAKSCVTLLKNENSLLPLSGTERIVFVVPYASQINSVIYAVDRLKYEQLIPSGMEVQTIVLTETYADQAAAAVQNAQIVIVVTGLYSEAELNPWTEAGSESWMVDLILSAVHANGGKLVQISAHFPYDTARYPDADAILACYNARGMLALPGEYSVDTSQYGPNLPAAIYTVFGGNNPTGKLPVNIPEISPYYTYTDGIAYERGFGLSY